jgi:serine protease Do
MKSTKSTNTDRLSTGKKIEQRLHELTKNKLVFLATFALITISIGFIGGWLGAMSRDNQTSYMTEQGSREVVFQEGEVISQIAAEVGPSVVSVNVTSRGQNQLDFFGFPRESERESAGTGFILSDDGIVITNRHVIPEGVTELSVTLSDGTELTDVEVVGRTNDTDPLDIAFLRIRDNKGNRLVPAKIGDSSEVKVGDRVIAIGNALGQFQNTVTSGIISGYGRDVQAMAESGTETLQNLFQTDAAINQGNSGGPLVSFNGEVIGINTAVAGRAQNIGFAIPIDDVKGLIRSVLDKGILERPFLGIRYVTLTDDYAFQFDLETNRGAYIVPSGDGESSIVPDSPAAEAGLQEGDIITEIDGTAIDRGRSLASLIGRKSVGEEVELTVLRDGETLTITVELQAAPTGS